MKHFSFFCFLSKRYSVTINNELIPQYTCRGDQRALHHAMQTFSTANRSDYTLLYSRSAFLQMTCQQRDINGNTPQV